MLWIDSIRLVTHPPAVFVAPMASATARRGALREVAAAALGLSIDDVEVAHVRDRRPRLVRPAGRDLHLSSASRDGVAALALAEQPIGVDIEAASVAEPPWQVLHPGERDALAAFLTAERTAAFARLWSLKEAYLKAIGKGLSREPGSFRVRLALGGDGMEIAAEIDDPVAPRPVRLATSRLLRFGDRDLAVAVVILDG